MKYAFLVKPMHLSFDTAAFLRLENAMPWQLRFSFGA